MDQNFTLLLMFSGAAVVLAIAFGFWAVIFIMWAADGIEQIRQRVERWIVHRRD